LNRVICADCLDVLAAMPTASVDFVLTDPPYLARYRDRTGRKVLNDDNPQWLTPAFREVARVMKPDTFCVSFYGWNHAELFLDAWRAAGLRPVGHIVFVKPYPSKQTRILLYRHEAAYVLAKGEPEAQRPLDDVLTWRYTGNRYHPTEKPVQTLRLLVEAFSRPQDIVLDPFAGSGSTALAARELGRRYVAVELDAKHAHTARERLKAEL
jgi:adenine-specific DNA-methyltransferase